MTENITEDPGPPVPPLEGRETMKEKPGSRCEPPTSAERCSHKGFVGIRLTEDAAFPVCTRCGREFDVQALVDTHVAISQMDFQRGQTINVDNASARLNFCIERARRAVWGSGEDAAEEK